MSRSGRIKIQVQGTVTGSSNLAVPVGTTSVRFTGQGWGFTTLGNLLLHLRRQHGFFSILSQTIDNLAIPHQQIRDIAPGREISRLRRRQWAVSTGSSAGQTATTVMEDGSIEVILYASHLCMQPVNRTSRLTIPPAPAQQRHRHSLQTGQRLGQAMHQLATHQHMINISRSLGLAALFHILQPQAQVFNTITTIS